MKSFVYFLNLAISDLILGIFIIAVKLMIKVKDKEDKTINHVVYFIQYRAIPMSLFISVFTISVLTFERMLAVKKPIYYRGIRFRTKCLISLLIWILTATLITILHVFDRKNKYEFIFYPPIIFTTYFLELCVMWLHGKHCSKNRWFQDIYRAKLLNRTSWIFVSNLSSCSSPVGYHLEFLVFCIHVALLKAGVMVVISGRHPLSLHLETLLVHRYYFCLETNDGNLFSRKEDHGKGNQIPMERITQVTNVSQHAIYDHRHYQTYIVYSKHYGLRCELTIRPRQITEVWEHIFTFTYFTWTKFFLVYCTPIQI